MYRGISQMIVSGIFKMAAVKVIGYFNFTAQLEVRFKTFRTRESVKYDVTFPLLYQECNLFLTN